MFSVRFPFFFLIFYVHFMLVDQQEVLPDMVAFMAKLREHITVGVVGGSDLPKQKEQLGDTGAYVCCVRACLRASMLFLASRSSF